MSSRRVLIAVAVLLVVGVATARVGRPTPDAPTAGAPAAGETHYQCSMHPQVVTDRPGDCPICGMKLQPIHDDRSVAVTSAGAEADPAPSPAARTPLFYRHPMRPDVVSSVPAKDEMGMDYIPVYDEGAPSAHDEVAGRAGFTLSSERQQLIGVTSEPVQRRSLDIEIRAAGRVAYDPKLYRAMREYREALRVRRELRAATLPEATSGADALVRGARLQLRQQGLADQQIEALARDDRDPVELLLPGESAWIYAQVYEYEAPLVQPGQVMTITSPALPGTSFTARVAAVDPILDPATRTVRVRALVATPEQNLRPESFLQVTIHVPLGEQLALPADAVLDTGDHQLVFVVSDDGRFEPRSIELGRSAHGYYEVRAGVSEGERVVTSANFLIDSESRFRAAFAAFKRAAPTP